jgi:immunity protein, SdpI family
MKLRPLAVLVVVTVVAMFAVSAWAWGQVPDGAQIPIHWGLDGRPNGYGPKWLGLLLTPVLGLVLGTIFLTIPRLDPRREHFVDSTRAWIWITGASMVMLLVVHVGVVAAVLGATIDIGKWIGVVMGALFVVIGNFLGKTRSNWFMGIRTPWTMSSERSWTLTHRLGGRLFVLIGLLSLILGLTTSAEIVFWTVFPGLGAAVIAMIVYSYFAWRDDPDRRAL